VRLKVCVRSGGGHFEHVLYNNQEAAVRWNGQLTAWFPIVEQGTRQGCNISPTEFNLYAERIMRTVEENYEGVVIVGRRITNLRYADDTTLLASTQERIKKFFKDLVQESARYNMYINAQKSKIMVVSEQDNISVQVDHEGESLEQVHDFKFLGSNISINRWRLYQRN